MPAERYQALCEAWHEAQEERYKLHGFEVTKKEELGSPEALQAFIRAGARAQQRGKK